MHFMLYRVFSVKKELKPNLVGLVRAPRRNKRLSVGNSNSSASSYGERDLSSVIIHINIRTNYSHADNPIFIETLTSLVKCQHANCNILETSIQKRYFYKVLPVICYLSFHCKSSYQLLLLYGFYYIILYIMLYLESMFLCLFWIIVML